MATDETSSSYLKLGRVTARGGWLSQLGRYLLKEVALMLSKEGLLYKEALGKKNS